MKFVWIVFVCALILTVQAGAEEPVLKDQKEKISYSIGLNIGTNLKAQNIDINPDLLARGIKDALTGTQPLLTQEEIKEVLSAFQKEMAAKADVKRSAISEKNKTEGAAFLAENGKKEGVVTLPSGLQYKILNAGTGAKPKATDKVVTNYKGTLIDGSEFDSSYSRGAPSEFPVNKVIAGWTEALQLMETGSKWQLFIPANLAYGEKGYADAIAPNSVLVFELELISIK